MTTEENDKLMALLEQAQREFITNVKAITPPVRKNLREFNRITYWKRDVNEAFRVIGNMLQGVEYETFRVTWPGSD